MRGVLVLWLISVPALAQSLSETSAVLAGATVGSAAGKKVSEGIDKTLRKTGGILDQAAKSGDKPGATKAPPESLLKVGAGAPKAEPNNVPPPPPPRRAVAARPPAPKPAPARVFLPTALASPARQPPANVDLAAVAHGMPRSELLGLGTPAARITMYQDGHLVEIYQYRNATLASGTVRLIDGAVTAVEARP